MTVSTRDNGGYDLDWHVPATTFCRTLLGDDQCDCVTCQIDAHPIGAHVTLGDN